MDSTLNLYSVIGTKHIQGVALKYLWGMLEIMHIMHSFGLGIENGTRI